MVLDKAKLRNGNNKKSRDDKSRKRMRVVIWKQWKKTMKRCKSLRQLGASHRSAHLTANCRKSYQYICGTATIHSAINNKRLKERGLVSLLDQFQKAHLIID